ncbi:MAG: hypothetical protein AB1743_08215 [Actinomycetota bacterium]
MSYSKEELSEKLKDMYPEIEAHALDLSLDFNNEQNAWVIHLKKGNHELSAFLDKKDADECMNGIKCVYLGIKIGDFIANFEEYEAKIKP